MSLLLTRAARSAATLARRPSGARAATTYNLPPAYNEPSLNHAVGDASRESLVKVRRPLLF